MGELFLLAFFLAILVGMLSAIMGIGGGAFYVPILMFLFGIDYKVAIGTSLVIIICSTLASALTYMKQHQIFFRVALYLAIPAIIASTICSYLTQFISTFYLSLFFALFTFLIGVQMIFPSKKFIFLITRGPTFEEEKKTSFGEKIYAKLSYLHLFVWGLIAGSTNGFTGLGGGIINIPAMLLGGVPIHIAVATSSFVIFCTSTAAALVHFSLGHTAPIPIFAVFIAGAMIGALIGARAAHYVPEKKLRFGFGFVVIAISLSVFLQLFL